MQYKLLSLLKVVEQHHLLSSTSQRNSPAVKQWEQCFKMTPLHTQMSNKNGKYWPLVHCVAGRSAFSRWAEWSEGKATETESYADTDKERFS